MPEDQTTTPNDQNQESSEERNWRELEADRDRWKAAAEELMPLKHQNDVRQAGFDPNSDKGKVLAKDLARGDVTIEDGDELPVVLRKYAEEEYDWKAPTQLETSEQQALAGQTRLEQLQNSSVSEQPAVVNRDQYERAIAEARQNGDFHEASRLQSEYERLVGSRAQAGV